MNAPKTENIRAFVFRLGILPPGFPLEDEPST